MQNIPRPSKKCKSKNNTSFNSVHPSLQSAINFDFHNGVVPFKKIAQILDMTSGRLGSYLSCPSNQPFKFAARHLLTGMRAAQSFAILEFLAANTGHFVFKVPLSRDPNPEKLLEDILCLKIKWEKLSTLFEKYYASGAADREVLHQITEEMFSFINTSAQLRAAAFMRLDRKGKNESNSL